jgi:acylphosphatase
MSFSHSPEKNRKIHEFVDNLNDEDWEILAEFEEE